MGAESHYFDDEFDEMLKQLVLSTFNDHEEELRDECIVKDVYDPNESVMLFYESQAERFWLSYREALRRYLIKEKDYEYNGTGVWLKAPDEGDINSFYNWLIFHR